MAVEPSEENITMVVEITQADRETARRYLKVKDNDPEKAINALFEGEDILQQESAQKWDDTAFSADRYGGSGQELQASASYSDGNLRPLGSSAAPTRGSSPAPSLRNAQTSFTSFQHPQTRAQEDAEMERALAASRQEHRSLGQETGVVNAAGKTTAQFGPATQSHYDLSQWAMTVSAPSGAHEAKEIIPDVEPVERRAVAGEPRFLKQVPSGDYLPNLLTIAHSIPLARETLLCRAHVQPTYGHDQDWWRGHTISTPRVVNVADGQPDMQDGFSQGEVVAEMQRLMAMLDRSERAYVSTEPLTKLATEDVNRTDMVSESALDHVLRGWETAASTFETGEEGYQAHKLFHSIIGTTSPEGVSPNMWSLPLVIASENRQPDGNIALADIMDTTLWDTDPEDDSFCDNYLERCADVLPMRITQDDAARTRLGLVVPAEIYIDKYLKENIAATRVVRKDMARVRKRMTNMDVLRSRISRIDHPTKNEKLDAAPVVESANRYFSGESLGAVLADYEGRGIDLPAEALGSVGVDQSPDSSMSLALGHLLESIAAKVRQLDTEKLKARELLSQLSQATPPELSSATLQHRYTLRGVATKPCVTYVLRPIPGRTDVAGEARGATTEPDEDGFDDEDTAPGWRWWRVEFDASLSSDPIRKSKAYQDDVIRAVELEHSSALLVYASDRAMAGPSSMQLPQALEEFVKKDNSTFLSELQDTHKNATHSGGVTASEWEDVYRIKDTTHQGRRGSASSTTAVLDHSRPMGEPPAYNYDHESSNTWDDQVMLDESRPLLGGGGSIGDGIRGTGKRGFESPEAHEIHLESDGMEMEETGDGLLTGIGGAVGSGGGARVASVQMIDADEQGKP